MGDKQIKHMVNRFLCWKLPENFNPDGGVSFRRVFKATPSGTNLLDATQAETMVRFMVEGMPVDEWLPIETAPKDGTAVLVYAPKNRSGGRRANRRNIMEAVAHFENGWGYITTPGDYQVHATHWRPLPAPPASSTGGK